MAADSSGAVAAVVAADSEGLAADHRAAADQAAGGKLAFFKIGKVGISLLVRFSLKSR